MSGLTAIIKSMIPEDEINKFGEFLTHANAELAKIESIKQNLILLNENLAGMNGRIERKFDHIQNQLTLISEILQTELALSIVEGEPNDRCDDNR